MRELGRCSFRIMKGKNQYEFIYVPFMKRKRMRWITKKVSIKQVFKNGKRIKLSALDKTFALEARKKMKIATVAY